MTATARTTTEDAPKSGKSTNAKGALPRVSGGLPVLGHTVDFIRDAIGLLERAHSECGNVAAFHVVGKDMVLLTGPAAQELFFRAPDEQISPREAYQMMVPVFGKGVAYDNEPKRMMEQLHMLLPALQDKRMRSYAEIIGREVEEAIAGWGDEGVVDFYEFCQVLTNFTSSHCLLGPEFRRDLTKEFSAVYHDLERSIIPLVYIHPHLPIPTFRKRDRARKKLGEMVSGIVEKRRKSGFVGEDFLQTLMESRYADGGTLTDHEITGMLVAAMFAGHHTSSVTTAWTMFELLQHPHELKRVVDEVDQVYAKDPTLSFGSVRELSVTEWAVKEALRIHPPLFILLRTVMQDFEISGYTIPKGAWLIVSPLVAHKQDDVFADAMKFDPDRYGPGRQEDKRPFSYISFGGGRHKCMGNSFALLQVKAIMAKLLHEYEFELYGDPIVADFQGLVIGPNMPCRVRYTRRRRAA
jgi:sterol 14-demethylase